MSRKLGIVSRIDLVRILAAITSHDAHKVTCTEQATFARAWPVAFENTDYIVVELPPLAADLMKRLTEAERAVCHLKIMGSSNGAIAEQRGVSLNTVENQVASIFRKLGISSRSELAALAGAGLRDPSAENLDLTK